MNKIFKYEENSITFQLENGDVMVNLTEMAKPFGKLPANFMNTDQTKQFISVLEKKYGSIDIPIVVVQNGGNQPGTWAHQKLALKFAAWLNPEFELWVYDRIEELLRDGYTKLETVNRRELALAIIRAEDAIDALNARLLLQETEIKLVQPKVAYHDKILTAEGTMPINVIAKDLGISGVTLNRKLHAMGIIYKSGGVWVLYSKYQDRGYTHTVTHAIMDSHGVTRTVIHTKWTQAGREFVINAILSPKAKEKLLTS